jgi:hypothetical protein
MIYRTIAAALLLVCAGATKMMGQMSMTPELAEIQQQLSGQKNIAYDYTIEQTLPDGTKNRLKGSMEKRGELYTESNDEELVIQNERWWYKVDHTAKTVFIIDARKLKKAWGKGGDIFNRPAAIVADSVMLKYGKLTSSGNAEVAKLKITFGPDVLVKEISLEYDRKNKIPRSYRVQMNTLFRIDERSFDEQYASQIFSASHFSWGTGKKFPDLNEYFSFEKNKIRLKKYQGYKLIQQT